MKILMLNYEFPPLGGGAGNATYYLLKEFAHCSDLTIDLVTSSVNAFSIEQFAPNVTIHFLNIGKNKNVHYQSVKDLITYSWKAFWYCRRLQQQKKFDLAHAFFGIPCGYIAMKLNLPYVVSLRGSDVPFYNKRFRFLDKLIFIRLSKKIWQNAYAVVANSKDLKNLALKTSPTQKISIIYNGVDTEEFKPPDKKSENDILTIISTGRLIPRKGYRFLIEAVKDFPKVKVVLVGDGPLEQELKKLAKKKGSRVEFIGRKNQNELIKYLQKANIFCLPSLNEGMSNSILEAMACGLPIITTDTGGSSEFIKNNGLVVQKGSVYELRKAIEMYKYNKNLIPSHSLESRNAALKMSWSAVGSLYINLYNAR